MELEEIERTMKYVAIGSFIGYHLLEDKAEGAIIGGVTGAWLSRVM